MVVRFKRKQSKVLKVIEIIPSTSSKKFISLSRNNLVNIGEKRKKKKKKLH